MTKTVFITVNPDLVAGKRMQTIRSLVTALDRVCDLYVIPITAIDFRKGTFHSYKRVEGGRFVRRRKMPAQADLWINWTDGYYLEEEIDYLYAQLDFYDHVVESGMVSRVVNTPEGERRTLKDWFAEHDCEKLGIIPTFAPKNKKEWIRLLREHGKLVAKPNWGGAGHGVHLIESERDLDGEVASGDYVCQLFRKGAEKRLWFCGKDCVEGRIIYDRKLPWLPETIQSTGEPYNKGKAFERDVAIAKLVWQMSGLEIGSVDFIGDEVNEINGCGTTFVYYNGWTKVVDARKRLIDYVLTQIN